MIKFFRKIRKNLLSEGKTGKYFKYAIGEIVLVVIGILIALSINNWNESRKENTLASNYRNKIINDLKTDLTNIDSLVSIGKRNEKAVIDYFNYFENQRHTNIQKLIDSCGKIIIDINKYRYTPNNYTLNDLLNSGNSTLLNEEQKSALVNLSNTQEYFLIVFEKTISNIIEYERKAKAYIDLDMSSSNFFDKINMKQSDANLAQGLLYQHNALSAYSSLFYQTERLKKRISEKSNLALKTLKN